MANTKSKAANDPFVVQKFYEDIEYFLFKKANAKFDHVEKLLADAARDPEKVMRMLATIPKDNYEKAKDLIFKAWKADSTRTVLALTRAALKLDPSSPDANILLALYTRGSRAKRREILKKGLQGAKELLGSAFFKKYKGRFGEFFITRPYLNCLEQLGHVYWEENDYKNSIKSFREMLAVSVRDHYGIRFVLLPKLLFLKKFADAEKLIETYKGENGASWLYSKAYLLHQNPLKKNGARKAARKAFKQNPFVPDYLLGKRKLPDYPYDIQKGFESEAIAYVHESIEMWSADVDSSMWLIDEFVAYAEVITSVKA